MDEIVLRAIAKWPQVPSVFNWLSADRRGNWFIKNERIANPTITEFIARNYAGDEHGRWFFQNGPQRVFVKLAYTPFVYRTYSMQDGGLDLLAHTESPVGAIAAVLIDETGAMLAQTGLGVGVIHDQDLVEISTRFVDASGMPIADSELENAIGQLTAPAARGSLQLLLSGKLVPVGRIDSAEVPRRFGFDPNPLPSPGQPEC